jgi:hypothetical protein
MPTTPGLVCPRRGLRGVRPPGGEGLPGLPIGRRQGRAAEHVRRVVEPGHGHATRSGQDAPPGPTEGLSEEGPARDVAEGDDQARPQAGELAVEVRRARPDLVRTGAPVAPAAVQGHALHRVRHGDRRGRQAGGRQRPAEEGARTVPEERDPRPPGSEAARRLADEEDTSRLPRSPGNGPTTPQGRASPAGEDLSDDRVPPRRVGPLRLARPLKAAREAPPGWPSPRATGCRPAGTPGRPARRSPRP